MATLKTAGAVFLSLTLCAASPAWSRSKPLTSVADLRYGVALYEYYNDDYFSALSELLIAEERGGIDGHGDNPEIMEGGLALGYRMERYASEIFERVLAENRSQDVQDSAWFFLSRLRYKNGHWQRAWEGIENISKNPPKEIVEDINALRFNLLLKQDQLAAAEELLRKEDFSAAWLPFIYFNLGSAYARQRDYEQAVFYFNRLSERVYQSEHNRALYDKAMTAAGYSYLFQQKYPEAMEQFARVRLSSKLSNRALLGYGWAAAELGDYQEALKPWLHLSKSSLIDENNQEAMIAVPYAYEKLGSEGLALQHYQIAEQSFVEEIGRLDEVIASLDDEELIEALDVQLNEGLDWLSYAEEKQLSPRLTYLVELFSKEKFQGSVDELRDLIGLREDLLRWQRKIGFYTEMIDNRESSRLAKAEYLQVAQLENQIDRMKARRAALAAEIERVGAERDFFALSEGGEAELVERVQRIQKNIDLLRASDPFIDEYEESARRFHGMLLWQASEGFSDRLWATVKSLNQLDENIAELTGARLRVQKLLEAAPDLDPYKVKMQDADALIQNQLATIDRMISRSEAHLRGQVINTLSSQRVKLQNFLAQSRLAIARIYDKAQQDAQGKARVAPSEAEVSE